MKNWRQLILNKSIYLVVLQKNKTNTQYTQRMHTKLFYIDCKLWRNATLQTYSSIIETRFNNKLEVNDALPSHGVKPTWGFHKVKLQKIETWRHAPDFQL
jgi:hypothetical protein